MPIALGLGEDVNPNKQVLSDISIRRPYVGNVKFKIKSTAHVNISILLNFYSICEK